MSVERCGECWITVEVKMTIVLQVTGPATAQLSFADCHGGNDVENLKYS